jgi:hypothetical protein
VRLGSCPAGIGVKESAHDVKAKPPTSALARCVSSCELFGQLTRIRTSISIVSFTRSDSCLAR